MQDYGLNLVAASDATGFFAEPFGGRHLIDGKWADDGGSLDRRSPAHCVVASRCAQGPEPAQIGAIATREHQSKMYRYVRQVAAEGANVCASRNILTVPGLDGQFYEPTVVSGAQPETAIAREEVFGPVMSVLPFKTADQAVRHSRDTACAGDGVDRYMDGRFPGSTFGGMKQSGQGSEIGLTAWRSSSR
jgi:Aldehyde dehydrogenase family